MSETSTTAMLVGTPDMFARRANAVTATIPRDEIAQALATEPPADLILDIARRDSNADESEERTVNVAWTQDDLESLLRLPGGEAVTFYFDPEELERVLEDDVEGHGLREAAVVLSIAAAAAVGAGNAAAIPDLGGAGQAQVAVAATHDEASLTERGIERTAAVHDEAGYAARGIEPGAMPATHDEATLVARGIEPGTLPAKHDEATLVARGIEHAPAVHDEATLVARGIEPGTSPAIHDEATLVARGIVEETPVEVASTGSGFEFPSVEPGTAAAVSGALAGAGLLIVGAAFATRRRQLGHP
jgi:hypothetical protein